ncbi:MAG: FAD-dependent monooxygenase, partial [Candidatus Acidiferrales bacterium]
MPRRRPVVDLASTTDVFVIGGGPSGLAAAIAARQKGFNVILADGAAPPIEKPCGEGMMPETITALRDLGVTIGPSDGVNFRGICFAQWDARVTGNFPSGLGVGMRRTALHE